MLCHHFRIRMYKDSERLCGERMLAPPAGSQPLPGWARGPLSVPCGLGTPTYKLQVKTTAPASRFGAAPGLPRVPAAPAPASRLGAAPGPPRAPVAPAPASRPGAAPGPPHVTWAPAPTFWLKAAPEPPRVPSTGSTGCKQNKQISPNDPAIMISIGARARISSKSLRDKGCFARSQDVQQAAH
jgi:hypothetical protein